MAKAEKTTEGFQLYDVKLRLSGDMRIEARRQRVTAPAVMLLGLIHGPDSLVQVTMLEGQTADHTDKDERDRLAMEFEGQNPHKRGFVARIFGAPTVGSNKLPRTIPDDYAVEAAVSVQRLPADSPLDPVAAAMA